MPRLELTLSTEEKMAWIEQAKLEKLPLATWARLSLNNFVLVKQRQPKHQRLLEAGPDPDPVDVPR